MNEKNIYLCASSNVIRETESLCEAHHLNFENMNEIIHIIQLLVFPDVTVEIESCL